MGDGLKQVMLGGSNAEQEHFARKIADALREALPKDLGFTLFVFDQKASPDDRGEGHVTYISTANREDMVSTIRAWLAKASL